jgi:peptide/nickel transport system substrate-binding protein
VEKLLTQSPHNNETPGPEKNILLRLIAVLPKWLRRLFLLSALVAIMSSFILLARLNDRFLVEVPEHGGTLTEGIIGRPRFINPVIAKSDADRDMTELIYSGLLRAKPDGTLTPDLASSYVISPDGLTYTFTLRPELLWHDGEPITTADVSFTIDKVRDQGLAIKSPRRASWEGVTVEVPDPLTIVFRLKQPYAPFLESTTMGILPKHIWNNVPDDEFDVTYYNIKPIGSGPYRVQSVVQDKDNGLPLYYDLVAWKHYAKGEPYIATLRMMFFGNNKELTQAYSDHTIDQMHTIEPALAGQLEKAGATIERSPLPRIFALYFNQNQQPLLGDKAVRQALALAVNKQNIVDTVLNGYGRTIDGPLPFLATQPPTETAALSESERILAAKHILEVGGWAPNVLGIYEKTDKKKKTVTALSFSISIPDVPELRHAAELVKSDWEKIGARVTLRVFESSSFTTEVLAPRKYDVLFYGQILARTPDPYAYWHSSQRNAPGLNVALYTNKKVDTLLESARKELDPTVRNQLLTQFVTELNNDVPAVFIYSPDFLYATGQNVHGLEAGLITTESERFLDVENWYINSERVWKWFSDRMVRPT